MGKHTPGPWAVNTRQGSRCVCIVQAEDNDWDNVCVNARDTYPRELMRDDACLIAAAPDLLVACEAALPIVCSRIEYPGDPCEKIADGIRAAIAKARGGNDGS